ncbi:MAG: murein biosynthesis integral membrane protein MurJ [Chloroflexota bacterium]
MKHVARSTLIISIFFGLEKVLGFVRQTIISRTFGRSLALDAYNAANNIPDMLFALISGGALAMALIPVLSEYLETKGRPQAWDLFSRIANLVFITTLFFSILIAIFADQLVQWNIGIAPGFSPEQQALVADLMRLNLFATMLFSISGLVIAGLQANQHFILPAIAPSMYDIGALIGLLILVPENGIQLGPITLPALGLGVHGMVYGTILGAALFLGIQIPGLLRYQFRWSPKIDIHHPGVRQVAVVLGPRILTVFFIQVIFIAQDNIASRLIAGSVTALVYGYLFMQVPESLIGTAIGTALLPTLSEQITRGETETFKNALNQSLRVVLALTIPITAIMIVGIRPLVNILGFDAIGSDLVVWSTRAYMIGLTAYSVIELTARAFYAQQKARIPLITIALTAAAFLLLAIPLAGQFGAPGIALANSLAFTLEAGIMLWLLKRKYPALLRMNSTLWRALTGAGVGSIAVFLLLKLAPLNTLGSLMSVLISAVILGIGGLAALPFIWKELKGFLQS